MQLLVQGLVRLVLVFQVPIQVLVQINFHVHGLNKEKYVQDLVLHAVHIQINQVVMTKEVVLGQQFVGMALVTLQRIVVVVMLTVHVAVVKDVNQEFVILGVEIVSVILMKIVVAQTVTENKLIAKQIISAQEAVALIQDREGHVLMQEEHVNLTLVGFI